MTYKIEKGIPIPIIYRKRIDVYPFKDLELGDSFFIPFGDDDSVKTFARIKEMNRIKAIFYHSSYYKKESKRITTKVERGGIRVWRIQ